MHLESELGRQVIALLLAAGGGGRNDDTQINIGQCQGHVLGGCPCYENVFPVLRTQAVAQASYSASGFELVAHEAVLGTDHDVFADQNRGRKFWLQRVAVFVTTQGGAVAQQPVLIGFGGPQRAIDQQALTEKEFGCADVKSTPLRFAPSASSVPSRPVEPSVLY